MPSLEEVCVRLLGKPGWVPKVMLGGALSFIPLINLLSFGYLLHYAIRLRQKNEWNLPGWKNLAPIELLKNGLHFCILLLIFVGIPIFTGWLISALLSFLTFGILGIIGYFPMAIGAFIAPFFFLGSIHAYVRDGLFSDAFRLTLVFEITKAMGCKLVLPVISFWGILLIALPFYGLSFFLGTWILIAYSSALNLSIMNHKN